MLQSLPLKLKKKKSKVLRFNKKKKLSLLKLFNCNIIINYIILTLNKITMFNV